MEKNTPGVMLRGQHISRTFGAGPVMGFSAKKRSRNSDLGGRAKSESRPWCAGWRLCRAGAAGLCRAAGASQPFAKKKRAAVLPPREDWNFCDIGATNVKETRLGEPVLGEPVLIGRAIKRGWGEPSNEVGASHQTRLGRAIKRGWASQY